MFGATPPRRTTRSSTRKDSDTLSSWSASSWSAKRPGKLIRWSVAMEPATRIGMAGTLRERERRAPRVAGPGVRDENSAAEAVAAGAAAAGVRVVDGEALLLDRVGEVDRRTAEVRSAHAVDDDRDLLDRELEVAVEAALVEEQLVLHAGAATGLDGDAQPQVLAALLLEQGGDLARGGVGQGQLGRRCVDRSSGDLDGRLGGGHGAP